MRPLPANRIVRGASDAVLSHQFTDADGDAAAPPGVVAVTVTRSDGTAVTVGAVAGTLTAPRTVPVGVAELATIDQLTAVWSVDGVAVASDVTDVVGGTVGSLASITAVETTLTGKDDTKLKDARSSAEMRFVETQYRSPVPRLTVERLDGTGSDWLSGSWPDLIEVRWVRIWSGSTFTELSADDLAAITVPDVYSRFRLSRGVWPCGRGNIEIGYVFGMAELPQSLRRAFARAVRSEYNAATTGVPERSTTWSSSDGTAFGISRPGVKGAAYGIDEIDAVFNSYRDPRPAIA